MIVKNTDTFRKREDFMIGLRKKNKDQKLNQIRAIKNKYITSDNKNTNNGSTESQTISDSNDLANLKKFP